MLIEKVGQMLIDLMTVFGQRLLGLHNEGSVFEVEQTRFFETSLRLPKYGQPCSVNPG